jgi:hypothetical protein
MTTKASNTVSQITRVVGQNDNPAHRVEVNSSGNTVIYKGNVLIATIKNDVVEFAADEAYLDVGGTPKQIATYPLDLVQLPNTIQARTINGLRVDVSNPSNVPTITVNAGECIGDGGEILTLTASISKRIDNGWVFGASGGGFCGTPATGSGGVKPPAFFQSQLRASSHTSGVMGLEPTPPSATKWYPSGKDSTNMIYDYETEAYTPVSIWIVKTDTLTPTQTYTTEIAIGLTADGSDVVSTISATKTVIDKRRIGWRLVYRSDVSPANLTNTYPAGTIEGIAALKMCRQIDDRVVFFRPIKMHLIPNDNWATYFSSGGQITRCPIPPNLVPDYFGNVATYTADGSNTGYRGDTIFRMLFADFEDNFSNNESGLGWVDGSIYHISSIGDADGYTNYVYFGNTPLHQIVTYPVVAPNAPQQYGKYRIKIDSNMGNGGTGSSVYWQHSPFVWFTGWTDPRGKDIIF